MLLGLGVTGLALGYGLPRWIRSRAQDDSDDATLDHEASSAIPTLEGSAAGPARKDGSVTGIELIDEVADALAAGRPVVALESTIISHGMPYPQNVAMATEVEDIVRAHGAVPATIAVLGGVPRIGLGADDLELLASDPSVVKASARDLPSIIARGGHGATTVAATMRLASLAGCGGAGRGRR